MEVQARKERCMEIYDLAYMRILDLAINSTVNVY